MSSSKEETEIEIKVVYSRPMPTSLDLVYDDWDDDGYWSDWDDDQYDDQGISNEDLGLCPHGCRDDDGCGIDGCLGGPDGASL
jgi:hypothetical protein